MKRQIASILCIFFFLASCQTVPITGRQQLSIIPSNELLAMSSRSYGEFLSKHKVITGANHGDERMSHALIAEMGGVALGVALSEKPKETNYLFMLAYGIGTQIGVLLPYSRLHESEADRLGLIFMAMAGYDPYESVNFWKRMAESEKGPKLPEFLSTHPLDKKRIENIEKLIPKAIGYYKSSHK